MLITPLVADNPAGIEIVFSITCKIRKVGKICNFKVLIDKTFLSMNEDPDPQFNEI